MRRFFEDPAQTVGMKLPQEVVDFVPSRDFATLEETVDVDQRYKTLVEGFEKLAANLRGAKTAKTVDYNRAINEHMDTVLLMFHELRMSYAKRAELEAYRASMESRLLNKAKTAATAKVTAKDVSKMGPSDLCKYHDSLTASIREQFLGVGGSYDLWRKQPGSEDMIEALDKCADASRRYTMSLKDFDTFKESEML